MRFALAVMATYTPGMFCLGIAGYLAAHEARTMVWGAFFVAGGIFLLFGDSIKFKEGDK